MFVVAQVVFAVSQLSVALGTVSEIHFGMSVAVHSALGTGVSRLGAGIVLPRFPLHPPPQTADPSDHGGSEKDQVVFRIEAKTINRVGNGPNKNPIT